MATTVTVTALCERQDGSPISGAVVRATLTGVDVNGGYIVPKEVVAKANVNGIATLALWPNQLGSTETYYLFRITDPVTNYQYTLEATVPNSDCFLHDIALLPPYDGKPDGMEAVEDAVDAMLAAQAAQAAAETAETNAETAATTATTQAGISTTQAGIATTQAGIATTQAGIATTQAGTATTQAGIATTKAGEAATSADNAASSASSASTSAGTATTQAGIATTKANEASASASSASASASTATTQAGIATTKANEAAASQTACELAQAAIEGQAGGAVSLTPGPSKIPLSGPDGRLDPRWMSAINDIGHPGSPGFGVGICPAVPAGYTPLAGCTDPASANYGNYQYSDGSIMVWVPAFRYRIGHANNPTYAAHGVNSIDVQPLSKHPDEATANAEGYALHRAFRNAGATQQGVFVDKYQCSNASGIASSLKNGNPLSTNSAHNPISALTGAPANTYGGVFAAVKTRGSQFYPASAFVRSALALLSMAHGQAATSATWCAWYDAAGVINFPKGCNNNALRDINDTSVLYVSDGYSNCGKTGSGVPFSKTTHNGQASGVADLNGNMWEIAPGVTCVAAGKTITGATQANPVQITVVAHGRTTGDMVMVTGVGGMTQINDQLFVVTVTGPDTLTLDGVNGLAFGAYTSGGTLTHGVFYALNEAADIATLTGGSTLATDAFGAAGVAAHSSPFVPTFRTDYPQGGVNKRFGRGANAVLSPAVSGAGWLMTGLGLPMSSGISDGTTGSNLFGADYLYQYIRNELCLISGARWDDGSAAGVWAAYWNSARASSSERVGFRAASYL